MTRQDADGPKLQRLVQRLRHKTPGLLYTVWHSSFNGFMAVQTQLGRFQNDTHLLFLPSLFCAIRILDKRPSGNDQHFIGSLSDADRAGLTVIRRDSFVLHLGTFRPLLPPVAEAVL